MGLEKDNIKDLFSAKLGANFEPEVPASVWAGIDLLLPQSPTPVPDASSASSSSSSSSAASSSVVKVVAITTGIAATVATGVLILQNKDSLPEEPANVLPIVEAPVDSLMIEEYSPDSVYEFIPLSPKKALVAEVVDVVEEDHAIPVVSEEVASEEISEVSKKEKIEDLIEYTEDVEVESSIVGDITNGLSVGLLARADILSGNAGPSISNYLMSPQTYTKYLNALEDSERSYEMEHSQPISIGLAIEKKIAPRLSIGTGIVYTYLSSTGKSSGVYQINEKQVFHYLGIPLTINYTFYELKKAKFYVSAGGMMQKDIQGRYTGQINMLYSQVDQNREIVERIGGVDLNSVQKVDGEDVLRIGSSKNKISQDNLQFSARLIIGASWPIYDKLSIYGNVGGAYYFDAGNKYRTIYSDQKTQLDLNVGLKIDF